MLTTEREIQSVEEIEVGTHGLIVEQGTNRGLLLPQVPGEHGWDRDAFLDHACVKAGLAADAWRRGARTLRLRSADLRRESAMISSRSNGKGQTSKVKSNAYV